MTPVRLFARRTTAGFADNRRQDQPRRRPRRAGAGVDVTRTTASRARSCSATPATTRPSPDGLPLLRRLGGLRAGAARSDESRRRPRCSSPAPPPTRTPTRGTRSSSRSSYGRELADAVQSRSRAPTASRSLARSRVAYEETPLPFEPLPTREQLEANLATDDEPLKAQGAIPARAMDEGERFPPTYPCPAPSRPLRQRAAADRPRRRAGRSITLTRSSASSPRVPLVWVAGYCNDMFGYVPTRRVQQRRRLRRRPRRSVELAARCRSPRHRRPRDGRRPAARRTR